MRKPVNGACNTRRAKQTSNQIKGENRKRETEPEIGEDKQGRQELSMQTKFGNTSQRECVCLRGLSANDEMTCWCVIINTQPRWGESYDWTVQDM